MTNLSADTMANSAASAIDNAADKLRRGIDDAQQNTKDFGTTLINNADDMGNSARRYVDTGTRRMQQGIKSVRGAAQGARDSVANSSEAMITFTKANPVKALLIAAASGAVIWALLKALSPPQER